MKTLTFKWLVIGGLGLIGLLLILTCLWKLTPSQQVSQKVASVDLQALLLTQLKGSSNQSDAELALRMKKLHHAIQEITQKLSQETGVLILSKDSLLSEAQDWTDVVRKRLEQRP